MTTYSSRCLAQSDLDFIPLEDLRPTQLAVGMRAIDAKRDKLRSVLASPKRTKAYLQRRPLPVVLGPGGHCYLIDKHHLSLALIHSGVEKARVDIIDDLSHMEPTAFWRTMEAEGRAYLFNEEGERVRATRLPRALSSLRADPYRDLAWAAREAGLFKKVSVPFSEFRWAAFFRARIDAQVVTSDFARALRMARQLAKTRAASSLPGYLH